MPSKVLTFPGNPNPPKNYMGYVAQAAAAYGAYRQGQQGGGGAGGAGGGSEGAAPAPQQTTVSPTFQQDFTAQVSPSISVQSGGGGTITSATSQQVTSEQTAEGGGSQMAPPGMPGSSPSMPYRPTTSFPTPSYSRSTTDRSAPLISSTPAGTNWTTIAVIGLAAVGLLFYMNKGKK